MTTPYDASRVFQDARNRARSRRRPGGHHPASHADCPDCQKFLELGFLPLGDLQDLLDDRLYPGFLVQSCPHRHLRFLDPDRLIRLVNQHRALAQEHLDVVSALLALGERASDKGLNRSLHPSQEYLPLAD